jgi:hypothetical protein
VTIRQSARLDRAFGDWWQHPSPWAWRRVEREIEHVRNPEKALEVQLELGLGSPVGAD